MLDKVRSNIESYLVKTIIFAVVFAFIGTIFLVWGRGGKGERQEQLLAKIYDFDITYPEYRKEYANLIKQYRNMYRDKWSDEMAERLNLKRQAFDNIVNQYVLIHKSKEWGINVTHEEIMDHIQSLPIFKVNGVFNQEAYQQRLSMAQVTPQMFERDIFRYLIYNKIKEKIAGGYKVTDADVLEEYAKTNEKIKAKYLVLLQERFVPEIKISLEELNEYFESHKDKYQLPERRSVNYLFFNPKDYEADANITDAEIKDYYNRNERRYRTGKQVKARHILLKIEEGMSPEDQEKRLNEAKELLEKIKAGEDFAELAKAHSDCPSSIRGGDLGYFGRGKMDPAFEKAAFTLDKGGVSDIVKSSFGYHIIKVEDIKPEHLKSLDEVRQDIITALRREKGKELALLRSEEVLRELYRDINKKFFTDFILTEKILYEKAGPFSFNDVVPGLERNREIMETIFNLEEINKISKIVETAKGYYIFLLTSIEPPRESSYAEAETKVEIDAKQEKAKKMAREEAEKIKERLMTGEDLNEVAKEYDLTAQDTGEFSRGSYITGIGTLDERQTQEVFSLDENEISPVFEVPNGFALFKVQSKIGINQEEFNKEKEDLRLKLIQQKKQELFNSWIERVKKKSNLEILNEELFS